MYHLNGLKGATRIVYEDLCRLLAVQEPVSVDRLVSESGYSRPAVINALKELRSEGLIEMEGQNGARAEYRLVDEGDMRLSDIFKAMMNFVALDGPDWMERMQIALVSHAIYNDGKRLRRLARKVGGDFQADVETWLNEHNVLRLTQVWELDEAYPMRDQIDALIAQAKERLTK